MLSKNWSSRRTHYDFVVVGSGYGGAIAAARLATAQLDPKPSVCILEKGKEWPVGSFPDTLDGILKNQRNNTNPLGLYEMLTYSDISVIKGSGLGGTSLINANVAIVPDEEVFSQAGWAPGLTRDELLPYYRRAAVVLGAAPHPRAGELLKVQALDRRAAQIGRKAEALPIAINFTIDGLNPHGVAQRPCIDCGDCVTGCNVGAKNTLYMNYLPMAARAGAEIYTQTKVEWLEKVPEGWRVHGQSSKSRWERERFTLAARNVILAAGSINSTEILMRSEMRGLKLSPRLGTGFGGNGDFFGLSYNGDHRTNVLGFGNRPDSPWRAFAPGPSIVAGIRYNGGSGVERRMYIEDLSFPNAYVDAARAGFALLRGEDTDIGDEAEERHRVRQDMPLVPRSPDGAMNHTMLYLCMGFDDARGSMVFDAPWFEPDGRMRIEWDNVGRQVVFTRINEELRRHARAQGGRFVQNPMWEIFNLRHLITAHPLGGCPVGEDASQGAVDEFGRVFAADGSIHEGLLVADGALIPSSLGVNPFLTICALAERIAERKIRQLQGLPYPEPPRAARTAAVNALEAVRYSEPELERLFRNVESKPLSWVINSGSRSIDTSQRTIRNDEHWKGFFPRGHILNSMSAALFKGFKKQFHQSANRVGGRASDSDGRIESRVALEEVTLRERRAGLEAGRYIVVRYLDPPWQAYYELLKVASEELLLGRMYLGAYPGGIRLFTFAMSRAYGFDQMSTADHRVLWSAGTVPAPEELAGVWRMDVISNANQASGVASLAFDYKPDGRLEARYQFLGLMEGLVVPEFVADHFRLADFTPFHDEIRRVSPDLLIGKYVTHAPPVMPAALPAASLGILHTEGQPDERRLGFYYLLTRAEAGVLPSNTLLQPFLDARVPDGVGMTFDEEMVGWYRPGQAQARVVNAPPDSVSCSFQLRLTIKDLNEFVEGVEHEARADGKIRFDSFEGNSPAVFDVDGARSRFHYLRVNPETREAEMNYHLAFHDTSGRQYLFEGRKFMQKDAPAGPGLQEVLEDYTTLFHTVSRGENDGSWTVLGGGTLKFRTFEDLPALGNLAGFLRSFTVTGTADPLLRLQAQARFLAFTAQFVQREYDPLSPQVAAGGGS